MSNNRSPEPVSSKQGRFAEVSQWTILTLLQWATGYFKTKEIDSPRSTSEILLAEILGVKRIELYLRYDQPLKKAELARFKKLIQRRLQNEPVAYITGTKEFWSLNLTVGPEVLIPRPETECLVEKVIAWIRQERAGKAGDLLDLGTGSGAIVLALASELPGWRFWATDRSPAAIAIACQNARENGQEQRVSFWVSNWFAGIDDRRQFDLVVSNPPYIPTADIEELQPEINRFEPRKALDGGADGLRDLERIIFSAPTVLKPGGALFMEIGYDQADGVRKIAKKTKAYAPMDLFQDYSNLDRVVRLIVY